MVDASSAGPPGPASFWASDTINLAAVKRLTCHKLDVRATPTNSRLSFVCGANLRFSLGTRVAFVYSS